MTIYDEIRAELDTVIASLEAAQKKLEAAERVAHFLDLAVSDTDAPPEVVAEAEAALAAYREAGE